MFTVALATKIVWQVTSENMERSGKIDVDVVSSIFMITRFFYKLAVALLLVESFRTSFFVASAKVIMIAGN